MLLTNFDILDGNKFRSGDEVWAFRFKPAKKVADVMEAHCMAPTLGQLKTHRQAGEPDEGYVQFFVPYEAGTKTLDWSRAAYFDAYKYADDEASADREYDRLVEREQVWHLLSCMVLNGLHTKITNGLRMGVEATRLQHVKPVNLGTFLRGVDDGTIPEDTTCYLVIKPDVSRPRAHGQSLHVQDDGTYGCTGEVLAGDVCLNAPLKLDHGRREAIVEYATGVQSARFRIRYEDLGLVTGYTLCQKTLDYELPALPVIYLHDAL